LDASLADGDAVAVQVHGGAAVGGQDFAAVTDGDARSVGIDDRVLLGELVDALVGPALDRGRAEVLRDCLAAGVEDVAAGAAADHARQDRQRAAELRTDLVIGHVHEDERAGLDFGDAVVVADKLPGPGAGAGDDAHGNAGAFDQPARADEFFESL